MAAKHLLENVPYLVLLENPLLITTILYELSYLITVIANSSFGTCAVAVEKPKLIYIPALLLVNTPLAVRGFVISILFSLL